MITYVTGDLFLSPAQTLVNTVNTVGVMGKGIALTFKKLYPAMFAEYQDKCRLGELEVGSLLLHKTSGKWILNFPTKRDWKRPSRVEYIEAGLSRFVESYAAMGIQSIAFPPLGCGNGELSFDTQVQPRMQEALQDLPIDVYIYRPLPAGQTPEHRDINTMRDWLRHDTSTLPAEEVWAVLAERFRHETQIPSLREKGGLDVKYDPDEDFIRVRSAGKTHIVHGSHVEDAWLALRSNGLVTTRTVPASSSAFAHSMLALLSQLDGVQRIRVAESYTDLDYSPEIGVQLVPPRRHQASAPQQLSLT